MKNHTKRMTERRFETRLARLLERALARSGGGVRSFAEAGILTMNKGLVVRLGGGEEFQITIVQSRRG